MNEQDKSAEIPIIRGHSLREWVGAIREFYSPDAGRSDVDLLADLLEDFAIVFEYIDWLEKHEGIKDR